MYICNAIFIAYEWNVEGFGFLERNVSSLV